VIAQMKGARRPVVERCRGDVAYGRGVFSATTGESRQPHLLRRVGRASGALGRGRCAARAMSTCAAPAPALPCTSWMWRSIPRRAR